MTKRGRATDSGASGGEGPERYRLLRRNLIVLMLVLTILPLTVMALLNFLQYRRAIIREVENPVRVLANKSRHSFELILAERLSVVRLIASAYTFEELADENKLRQIFSVVRHEFSGFVDLGVIDSHGVQVSYVGPYQLKGKEYDQQSWFHEVQVHGSYISDVFLGHRGFPHIVMAVQPFSDNLEWWLLRATIDTKIFDDIIAAIGLGDEGDAFVVSRDGVLQTNSRFYGKALEPCPLAISQSSWGATASEQFDAAGREVLVVCSRFINSDFVLVIVKPRAEVLRNWYTLKGELFYIFLGAIVIIVLVVFRLSSTVVQRIKDSDEKRQLAFREMEHTHKLSSIGRLAAGVAHEINNPMEIINQKAGLMRDLVEHRPDFPHKEKFLGLVTSILNGVDRCRTITHRLLGFARRMEVEVELLDLNGLLKEVLGFLEKEAEHRNISVRLELAAELPRISSDRGQLQQVFLNILANAYAAVDEGGIITITTWPEGNDTVATAIQDNGCGMSEETRARIFEPFFTTKREYGTGLGLSITYGIIKKLGGDVKVDSALGKGTTFTVYLPTKSAIGEPG
jgi:two-component system NtrC family sensor kinase